MSVESLSPAQLSVHPGRRRTFTGSARWRAQTVLATAALGCGVVLVAVMQALPGARLDPRRAPLSRYALAPHGWLFGAGMVAFAVAVALLVSALLRAGCIRPRSPAAASLLTCAVALVAVAVFPEHTPTGQVHVAGIIHWSATMVAFGGLCVTSALMHQHADPCSRLRAWVRRIGAVSGPLFLVVLAVSLLHYATDLPIPPWWFGVGERVLVGLDVGLAAVLLRWAWQGCTCGVPASGRTAMTTTRSRGAPR